MKEISYFQSTHDGLSNYIEPSVIKCKLNSESERGSAKVANLRLKMTDVCEMMGIC